MSAEMEKIAGQFPAVVTEARDHLRKMAHSLVAEREKSAALEKELRLHKLARRMEARRIDDELDFDQKLAKLASIPDDRIDSFETALEMSPGGFKLGSLQDQEETSAGTEGLSSTDAQKQLDSWILSGAAHG